MNDIVQTILDHFKALTNKGLVRLDRVEPSIKLPLGNLPDHTHDFESEIIDGYTDEKAVAAVENAQDLDLKTQEISIGCERNPLGSVITLLFGDAPTTQPVIFIHSIAETNATEQAIGINAKGNYIIGVNRNSNNKITSWLTTQARASKQRGIIKGAAYPNFLQSPVVVWLDAGSNYAYVAAYGDSSKAYGDNSLVIIDVRDKDNPTVVAHVKHNGDTGGVHHIDGISATFIYGNYCYVTGFFSNSFLVYDISDPINPNLVGGVEGSTAGGTAQQYFNGATWEAFSGTNYLWGASASWVYKQGAYLYAAVVSRKDGAFAIYDVTNPRSISLKSVRHHKELGGTDAYELAGALSVQVEYHSGDDKYYAYVGTRWQGYTGGDGYGVNETNGWENQWKTGQRVGSLTIFDVTSPSSLIHKGEVHGKYASDPTKPLSEIHWIQYVKDVGNYSHEYVYSACFGDNAMSVIDVSTKTAPVVVNFLRGAGTPNFLDGAVGLHVKCDENGDAKYCYVVCFGDNGFVILDVENISGAKAPTRIGGRAGSNVAGDPYWLEDGHSLYVDDDNYLYIVCRGYANSFSVFSVENSVNYPSASTNSLTPADINNANRLVVFENYAYIPSYSNGKLVIIDVTDPSTMAFVASYSDSNYTDGITSVRVCYSDGDGKDIAICTAYTDNCLMALDVTTKSAPSLLNAQTGSGAGKYLGGAYDCEIIKNGDDLSRVIVVSYSDNALAIYDWTSGALSFVNAASGSGDPSNLGGARGVRVLGNYAFVIAKTDDALTIWNIANVTSSEAPIKIKTFSGSGSPNYMNGPEDLAIDAAGEFLYVAARDDDAIVQIDISDPTSAFVSGVILGATNDLDGVIRLACVTLHGDEYIIVASYDSGKYVILKKSDFSQKNIVGLRNYYGQMQKRNAFAGTWSAI